MFDPKNPYNDLPLLPGKFDFNQVDILKATIKANKNLAKLNGLALLLPNAQLLMSPLLVKESVESSAIENIHTTTQKVLQWEAIWSELVRWPEKEVLYYRKALIFGINQIKQYWWIPTNLLVEVQNILEPSKQWVRKIPWTIIANDKTGEVIYTPPEGEQRIKDFLSNLEKFINNMQDDIDPLIKLWAMHYQFEAVHPFYDGNWRTGRMLMILYLILSEKLEYPVLFISEYINKTRSLYYQLLNQTSKTWDYKPFILYILEAISEQALVTEQKIIKIKDMMSSIEMKMKWQSNLDYHQISIVLFSHPYITISWLAEKLNVVRQTINRYVKQLEKLGIIKTEKVGKNKLIYIPEFIQLLS